EQLTKLAAQYPGAPSYLSASLGRAELQLAKVLLRRNETGGAREATERALGHHQAALRSSPGSLRYRQNLWDDHLALSFIRLQLHDSAGAANDAEELPRIQPDSADGYVQAALLLVQCAKVSPEQKVQFHDRAMKVLGEGVKSGKLDRRGLDFPGLNPLR